ncbi:MAG: hypothetical protein MUC40_00670 [Akkermansiaceae bacterium]|nr:hypothetical protein [Akkermansiaceae bacterium]
MNEAIHCYQMRHLFHGDNYLGIYEAAIKTARIVEAAREHAQAVKAYFMRRHGLPVTVLVGDEEAARIKPLMEFPAEIRAGFDPYLGDMTPAAIAYARAHFPADEFARRYAGRITEPLEIPAPAAPKRRGRPPKQTAGNANGEQAGS